MFIMIAFFPPESYQYMIGRNYPFSSPPLQGIVKPASLNPLQTYSPTTCDFLDTDLLFTDSHANHADPNFR